MNTKILSPTLGHASPAASSKRNVILASCAGALLEWYDFYIYAGLAIYFSALFFPPGNEAAAVLGTLATFGAGFLVRPLGAMLFGRLGDLVGRKHTFLITMILMGIATVGIGLLPTYESIGISATVALVVLRLLQGLAMGGEIGGAVTYLAEHSPHAQRGLRTSILQTTAALGLVLSLAAIYASKSLMDESSFREWGWRLPFLFSFIVFIVSLYIRSKLNESPTFLHMKAQGGLSRAPLSESFSAPGNLRAMVLLLIVSSGLGAIFGTSQFYTMFFMTQTLRVPMEITHALMAIAVMLTLPLYVFFGWVSDKAGRKPVLLAACILASVTIMPLFKSLTHYANPALERFQENVAITVEADGCEFNLFSQPTTSCDKTRALLTRAGAHYTLTPASSPNTLILTIGQARIDHFHPERIQQALATAGLPASAEPSTINHPMLLLVLMALLLSLVMIFGPIAAFMAELFPARLRYTSMSLPFNLGTGWIGGMLSFVVSAMSISSGNIYFGLWYPTIVTALAAIVILFAVPETRHRSMA